MLALSCCITNQPEFGVKETMLSAYGLYRTTACTGLLGVPTLPFMMWGPRPRRREEMEVSWRLGSAGRVTRARPLASPSPGLPGTVLGSQRKWSKQPPAGGQKLRAFLSPPLGHALDDTPGLCGWYCSLPCAAAPGTSASSSTASLHPHPVLPRGRAALRLSVLLALFPLPGGLRAKCLEAETHVASV